MSKQPELWLAERDFDLEHVDAVLKTGPSF
jgi:hypothetical protein